jgi:hypothetical protein
MIGFRETFIQDVGCDRTDISEDIDLITLWYAPSYHSWSRSDTLQSVMPLRDFWVCGCGSYTMIGFRETFIQDVGCNRTDISEDIDLKVPICCTNFGTISLLYLCMNIPCFIYCSIHRKTHLKITII